MSAAAALDTIRERRAFRNRRDPGLRLRYGVDGYATEAEAAALRLAQHEADQALVAQELARADDYAAKTQAEREAAPAALEAALARYVPARARVMLALAGGTLRVEPGVEAVEVVGLLDAITEARLARSVYEEAFALAMKHDLLGEHVRIPPLAIGPELTTIIREAGGA